MDVPTVATSPAGGSSSWAGIDGFDTSDLIQAGTEQESGTGTYLAWIEMLPADEDPIEATVDPGDAMELEIVEVGTNQWEINLTDETQNWYFGKDVSYDVSGASAEWIEEAPESNGEVQTLADFGSVTFSHLEVNESGTWYYTDMNQNNIINMNQGGGGDVAMPGTIGAVGDSYQSFTDHYVTSPTTPSTPAVRGGAGKASLSWSAPSSDGGVPISAYQVDAFRGSKPYRTYEVGTGTSATIHDLPAGAYSFAVRAENQGGWYSPYSSRASVVMVTAGAPSIPAAPTATRGSSDAVVHWSAPSDNGTPIDAYNLRVYGGSTLRKTVALENVTSDTVTGLSQGSYSFTVQAKDTAGLESNYSAHSSAVEVAPDELKAGQSLLSGQELLAGAYRLVVQASDGNVVLYHGSKALWDARTGGHKGDRLVLQGSDGNLVIYSSAGKAIWTANTEKHPEDRLVLQSSDGNLVVYTSANKAIWNTHT